MNYKALKKYMFLTLSTLAVIVIPGAGIAFLLGYFLKSRRKR